MCTLSIIGAKIFGDREVKLSVDREGYALWVFAVLADIGMYSVFLTINALLARVL